MNNYVCLLRVFLPWIVLVDSAFAEPINYPNFSSPTNLIFQADARLEGDFVRLTPSRTNMIGRVGGLWFQTKQPVRDGFETTFQFRISNKVRHGGDGFVFALQNNATPSIGLSGSNLGFFR